MLDILKDGIFVNEFVSVGTRLVSLRDFTTGRGYLFPKGSVFTVVQSPDEFGGILLEADEPVHYKRIHFTRKQSHLGILKTQLRSFRVLKEEVLCT